MRVTGLVTDPATDAATLLRRLGMAVLAVCLPVGALLARRGVLLFLPIAVVLLLAAWALERRGRADALGLERIATSPTVAAIGFGLAWAALSLAWTVGPGATAERLGGVAGTLLLAIGGFLALPERVRASNLYLVPIGTAVAAILAIALALLRPFDLDEDGRSLGRGIAVVALLVWPAVAWLRSRNRDAEAACLAVVVAVACVTGGNPAPLAALAIGAAFYGAASLRPASASAVAAAACAAIVLCAPLLPAVGAALLDRTAPGSAVALAARDWSRVVAGEPLRLLTGYGIGSLFPARLAGQVPPATPDTPLLQVWYEFGLVGALSAAGGLWFGLRGAATVAAPLRPGIVAAIVAAFTIGVLGIGSGQAWWPSALTAVALVFVCVERGQFRTRLPRARRLAAEPVGG